MPHGQSQGAATITPALPEVRGRSLASGGWGSRARSGSPPAGPPSSHGLCESLCPLLFADVIRFRPCPTPGGSHPGSLTSFRVLTLFPFLRKHKFWGGAVQPTADILEVGCAVGETEQGVCVGSFQDWAWVLAAQLHWPASSTSPFSQVPSSPACARWVPRKLILRGRREVRRHGGFGVSPKEGSAGPGELCSWGEPQGCWSCVEGAGP